MVDTFQKSYESLQVPYPKSTMDAAIEQQASQQKADYEKFVASSKARIDGNFRRKENMILGTQKHNCETYFFPPGFSGEVAKWQAMKPVEDMCLEEAYDSCPEVLRVNPDKPTFWPHDQDYEEWRKWMKENKEEAH